MKVSKFVLLLAVALVATPASAASVGWISLNAPDTINPNDQWFTDIVEGAGHSVTRYQVNGDGSLTPDRLAELNAEDLLILGRANGSGNYDEDAQQWNEDITTAMLLMSPYLSRNSRLGWAAGSNLADSREPSQLLAEDGSHPAFTGVEFDQDGVTTANAYNTVLGRGISTMTNPPVEGGTIIATNPVLQAGIDPAQTAVVAAEWPAGTLVPNDVGDHVLAGPRYYYAGGSREAGGVPIPISTLDLTVTGRRIYFNMVEYSLGNDVPEPGDFNRDGNVDIADFEALSDNLYGHLDGLVGFNSGDIDLDRDVDINDFGMFRDMYPAVVAQATGIPEPSTLALICVFALCGLASLRRRMRAVVPAVGALTVAGSLLCGATLAQETGTWVGATGDWNVGSNWDLGFVPIAGGGFNDVGIINNGGTAQVDQIGTAIGNLTLGGDPGMSGNLEILAGGEFFVGEAGDQNIDVGLGSASIFIANGGSLTAENLLWNQAENVSLTLGEIGGAGDAAMTLTGNATANLLHQTTINGPNVLFNIGDGSDADLLLGQNHTLIQGIEGTDHSTIMVANGSRLDGVLHADFAGDFAPAVGNSWDIINSEWVFGEFDRVTSNKELPAGYGLAVNTREEMDGDAVRNVVSLDLETRLTLVVDPMTGASEIANMTDSDTFDFFGYGIVSDDAALTPDTWSRIGATWRESNSAPNHIGELTRLETESLGPGDSLALGTAFDPNALSDSVNNLFFQYQGPGGSAVQGAVVFGEVEDGGGGGIAGDYNNSGQVEQGDLDLVLLNWGDTIGDPNSIGWTNPDFQPDGQIDQGELDGVLLNWGNTAGLAASAAVPEPSSLLLMLLVAGLAAVRIRR